MRKLIGLGIGLCVAGLYLSNASWLAAAPTGQPTVIAQRGVHQVYEREGVDDRTCTARRIRPPSHLLIDNTLPSIAKAFEAGANIVEVDVRRTQDRHFVLFHDHALDCRTHARGLVSRHTLAELKNIDVGHGYTADNGNSYPLRGRGVGLMPTLEEALRSHPTSRFLIQFKDGHPNTGDLMVSYLKERGLDQWNRLSFFGSARPLKRLKILEPNARIWSGGAATRCLLRYIGLGWSGYVPAACDGGIVIVPISQSTFIWGWPNRFFARMHAHQTEVMVIGEIDGLSGANFSRFDTLEELEQLPPGFAGSIWTDRVEIIGPALARQSSPL